MITPQDIIVYDATSSPNGWKIRRQTSRVGGVGPVGTWQIVDTRGWTIYYNNSTSYTIPLGGAEAGWRVYIHNNGLAARVTSHQYPPGKGPKSNAPASDGSETFTCHLRRGRWGGNNLDIPLRINRNNDVECYTDNNRDCAWHKCYQNQWYNGWLWWWDRVSWGWLDSRWRSPNHALSCGTEHAQKWGGTGYGNTNHWCHDAANEYSTRHNMRVSVDPNNIYGVIVSGHIAVPGPGGNSNVNGTYEMETPGIHYCEKAGISNNEDDNKINDYGLDYVILPGKKSKNTLTKIDKYKHIHNHTHDNDSHSVI